MASHSVSAFQITVRNPAIKGRDKSSPLDSITVKGRSYDFLDLLEKFLAVHSAGYKTFLVNQSNKLVKVLGVQRKKGGRDISCYVAQGTFGVPGDIISSRSLRSTHKKQAEESDVAEFYAQFRVPTKSKVGFVILHSIGNASVKSWLSDQLGVWINNQLSGCAVSIRPLCSKIALRTYLKEAEVRAIRITHFEPNLATDVADYLLDDKVEKTLLLKREGGFGRLIPFLGKGKKREQLVALSDEHCTAVKADVTFNGRNRTISLEGSKDPKAKFYLSEPDTKFHDGLPTRASISIYATGLLDDLGNEVSAGN
ncbi:hypothetical protein L3067_18470 [Xanthomonas sp. PPL568]|uniref:hypothetical protein n=1 Tax=Xanthomonas indica TaxID=2912242 RepID=UPI001F575D68|nr:hypothetical protein [Xanthomonas indica]MCI2246601.1 hypothetical protein [Xanthomonas indica]